MGQTLSADLFGPPEDLTARPGATSEFQICSDLEHPVTVPDLIAMILFLSVLP